VSRNVAKIDFGDLEPSLQRMMAPIRDELLGAAEDLRFVLIGRAPVKTGRFRDGWEVGPVRLVGPFKITASVVNDTKYGRYIRSTKVGTDALATRDRSPFTEARKIARAQSKEMGTRIVDILAEGLEI